MLDTTILRQTYPNIDHGYIESKLRQYFFDLSSSKHWKNLLNMIEDFKLPSSISMDPDTEGIELNCSLSETHQAAVSTKEIIEALVPWRIGPYNLFGESIESEWNSEVKWKILEEHLKNIDLEDKKVLDLGANNGYFSFRAATLNPKLVLALEPVENPFLQLSFLLKLFNLKNVLGLPFGFDDLESFRDSFDLAICMGVIYHRHAPILSLKKILNCLKPGGHMILDSITVNIDGPYALSTPERYAKMRNAWFVPSPECLQAWTKQAGFKDIEVLHHCRITTEEQRRSAQAPFESLEEFLDPIDKSKTIEGYPAPWRTMLKAKRA